MLGVNPEEQDILLSDLHYSYPLVYNEGDPASLRTSVTVSNRDQTLRGSFQITSTLQYSHLNQQTHCTGLFKTRNAGSLASRLAPESALVARRLQAIRDDPDIERFRGRTIYDTVFPPAVVYAPCYQSIRSITLHSNGIDSCSEIILPPNDLPGVFTINPIFLDALIHFAGFVVNLNTQSTHLFICDHIGKVEMLTSHVNWMAKHYAYCSLDSISDSLASTTILLSTEGGTTIGRIKNIRFKRVKIATLAMSLSRVNPRMSDEGIRDPETDHEVDAITSLADTTVVEDSSLTSTIDLESVVVSTISRVLEIPTSIIALNTPLSVLGLDSLAAIEAVGALQAALNLSLPHDCLFGDVYVSDIVGIVENASLVQSSRTSYDHSHSSVLAYPPDTIGQQRSTIQIAVEVKHVFASVLGLNADDLDENTELNRYGFDSLATIEVHYELERTLKISFSIDLLYREKTLKCIQNTLVHLVGVPLKPSISITASPRVDSNPIQLQDGDPLLPPLVLIHDGSGHIAPYARLHSLGRRVYGVFNTHLGSANPWKDGILEMASVYTSMIEKMNFASCIVGGKFRTHDVYRSGFDFEY